MWENMEKKKCMKYSWWYSAPKWGKECPVCGSKLKKKYKTYSTTKSCNNCGAWELIFRRSIKELIDRFIVFCKLYYSNEIKK